MTPLIFKIQITPPARADILDQARYYREQSSPALAQRWRTAVNQLVLSLTAMPERAPFLNSESLPAHTYRHLAVPGFSNHSVVYRLDLSRNLVTIVADLHGARNADLVLLPHRI